MEGFWNGASSDGSSETMDSTHFSVTPNESHRNSSSETPTSEDSRVKKRGRKGHTKSRAGCFNCKKARIKCKENRPACDYCAHRGLHCEWPDVHINQVGAVIRKANPTITIPAPFQQPEPILTIQDFRLFHHFIQTAYPHHPIGNDSVWTHEIPSIASNHDYLLHAMLGLSASDIICHTADSDLTVAAINHRCKSIESLNRAVSLGIQNHEQGNAMIATCYALLFQSTLINDGVVEYMTFIRGIVAIAIQMGMQKMQFLFVKMLGDEPLEAIDDDLKKAPLLEAGVVAAACRSLEKIGGLCTGKTENVMFGHLLSMARNLITSSRDAYISLRRFYEHFIMMPHASFRAFIDPSNPVSHLLQAHFVAMQLLMTPITKAEWANRVESAAANPHEDLRKTGKWLCTLHESIPLGWEGYYEWTLWIDDQIYNKRYMTRLLDGEGGGLL